MTVSIPSVIAEELRQVSGKEGFESWQAGADYGGGDLDA
jgi:hypothetical protein